MTVCRRLGSECIALKWTKTQTTRESLEVRLIFGMVSLLTALVMVGLQVKKQPLWLPALPVSKVTVQDPNLPGSLPDLDTLLLQSQKIQRQIQQSSEVAIQRRKVIDAQ